MEVHQFLTSLSYGDAIGDYVLEIQAMLRKKGYQSEIYSEHVDPFLANRVRSLHQYELDGHDNVLMLIHFSIGSELGDLIPYYKGKKLLIYHNITPYEWFIDINPELAIDCLTGRLQLRRLKDFCAIAVADSEYNRAELQEMGYANTAVLPIRVHFDKFDKKEDAFTRHTYDDDRTNIVVVGRTIPNKKLEDCLKIFACYQKYLNPRSRLIFAGFWRPFAPYYFALRAMTQELQLREVVFTGHVRFEELLAYYRMADVLLSMSEHEGFCV
ncbi:MAG TPA: glycosyltransferase, partial [Acidobacteriota bacterium]|nr:glycosyltransferase [Acidobacteriota bacterium]